VVDCSNAAFLRASWYVYEDLGPKEGEPREVVLASNGRAVGDVLEVSETGPLFSDRVVGMHYYGMGAYRLALEPLERAVKADPSDGALQLALVFTHDALGNAEAALAGAERLLDEPGALRDEVFEVAGHNAAVLERFDDAEAFLLRGLEEFPGQTRLQLELGKVHRQQLEFPAAEQWLLRAARTDPSGEAFTVLSEVMSEQNERSLAALSLVRARLSPQYGVDREGIRQTLTAWVTPRSTWPGGSTQRGPLSVVGPLRVNSTEPEVAAAQVSYLLHAWAKAGRDGRKSERLRNDPWYSHVTGLVEQIVEAGLTEPAAWIVVSQPGQWPIYQNVGVERVFRLVDRYEAQIGR
jgi:tetratricopeptide (TPR) repeat protein